MKNRLIIAFLLCLSGGFTAVAQSWKREDFRNLMDCKGIWFAKKSGLIEAWTIKSDTLLESKSYYVKGKKETLAETVQLVYSGGKIQYIVTAYGQNDNGPVAFDLVSYKDGAFTFENKSHDFPQQIIYRFPAKIRMQVRINGTTVKGFKKVDFEFVKMARRKYE